MGESTLACYPAVVLDIIVIYVTIVTCKTLKRKDLYKSKV